MLPIALSDKNLEPGQCHMLTGSYHHDCCIMAILVAAVTTLAVSIFTHKNHDAPLGSMRLTLSLVVFFASIVTADDENVIYADELHTDAVVNIFGEAVSTNEIQEY